MDDRMSKMRTDVERLRHERERERAKRELHVLGIQDLSEKVLKDAKVRLESLQHSVSSLTSRLLNRHKFMVCNAVESVE